MAKDLNTTDDDAHALRAAAATNAHHSTRLEGGQISDYAQALQDCVVEGLISFDDQMEMLKKHHGVG